MVQDCDGATSDVHSFDIRLKCESLNGSGATDKGSGPVLVKVIVYGGDCVPEAALKVSAEGVMATVVTNPP